MLPVVGCLSHELCLCLLYQSCLGTNAKLCEYLSLSHTHSQIMHNAAENVFHIFVFSRSLILSVVRLPHIVDVQQQSGAPRAKPPR